MQRGKLRSRLAVFCGYGLAAKIFRYLLPNVIVIMHPTNTTDIRLLTADDIELMRSLLKVFGEAFDEVDTYCGRQPTASYLQRLLGQDHFIALVALENGEAVGGLAAYELRKFEQERSEIYIYDLAIDTHHRRKGIATALINALQDIAAERGAYVIFVQADYVDTPAVKLYEKLGVREEVLHFDIAVPGSTKD